MKKIILMGIPHHGNIGDNAISVAEEEMLKDNFSDYELYFMQEKFLDICSSKAQSFIHDNDVILLHGGGNIGDTYERPEKGRRSVIQNFPNNKIIVFPQTAFFSNTEHGKAELALTKKIYNAHKELIIMAREETSFKFMKENFTSAKIELTPDIVLTLDKTVTAKRTGALLLFRTDSEKTIENSAIDYIESKLKSKYDTINVSDMNLGSGIVNIGGKLREAILSKKFKDFQTSEIVITDRLHGMIFSAITSTPCIVFGNFNHKISESYKWLKNLDYICFCNDISEFDSSLNKISTCTQKKYDNTFAYESILKILNKEIRNS